MFSIPPHDVPRTGDDRPVESVWAYAVRMTGRHQFYICVLAAGTAAVGIVPIDLQRRIIDDAVAAGDGDLLVELAVVYAVTLLLHQGLKWAMRVYQGWLNASTVLYTRSHLLGLYRDRRSGEGRDVGQAISVVSRETENLGGFVGESLSQAVANGTILIGVIIYMMTVEPVIALVSLLLLAPQAAVTPLMQLRLNQLIQKRVAKMRDLGEHIAQLDKMDTEPTLTLLNEIYRNRISFYVWKFLLKGTLNLLNAAAPLVVLLWGGWLVLSGETTVGVLVAFIAGFERMSSPVRDLIGFYRTYAQAEVQHAMVARWM